MKPKEILCRGLRKLFALGVFRWLPDKPYLRLMYYAHFGKKLDLKNPKTFNEKLQWLKLYDRNPEYIRMVDKYEAKQYVAEKIGEKYIIPTLGVWDNPDQIDFDALPEQFVLKCTHDSGGVVICKDKSKADISQVKETLRKRLNNDYSVWGREWPYKFVNRKIIAEKYMVDESGTELKDYKVFCFGGEPQFIQVDFGRFTGHERNLYSTEWKYMGFTSLYPTNPERKIERPTCLARMLDIARVLSRGLPVVRVDLYVIGNDIYFGELTVFHGSGLERFTPPEWDAKLGDLICLDEVRGNEYGEKNCDI